MPKVRESRSEMFSIEWFVVHAAKCGVVSLGLVKLAMAISGKFKISFLCRLIPCSACRDD